MHVPSLQHFMNFPSVILIIHCFCGRQTTIKIDSFFFCINYTRDYANAFNITSECTLNAALSSRLCGVLHMHIDRQHIVQSMEPIIQCFQYAIYITTNYCTAELFIETDGCKSRHFVYFWNNPKAIRLHHELYHRLNYRADEFIDRFTPFVGKTVKFWY